MKRIFLFVLAGFFTVNVLFAGGIVTNTNQSAAWVRWLVMDASTGIDAAYYNPAGLMELNNGFHLSLSNQFIFQTQTITSDYTYLNENPKNFSADVKALLFPDIYAVYKLDKFAFSFGLMPIGGGGSADFAQGTPSFEIPVSNLPPLLYNSLKDLDAFVTSVNGTDPHYRDVTGYGLSAAFNGSSVYLGYQGNVSYAVNDMLSLSVGVRYVVVNNTYKGHLTDIVVDAPDQYGGTQPPAQYLNVVADDVENINHPFAPGLAAMVRSAAADIAAQTADAYVDVKQTGHGITPVIGINIHPMNNLNIGLKYEHHTRIEVTNHTTTDSLGMFPDGAKSRSDLPSMFSAGVSYQPLPKLTVQAGFHYYLDKTAYYGKVATDSTGMPIVESDGSFVQVNNEDFMNNNTWELGVGVQYMFSKMIGVSAGYLKVNSGANERYQSDLGYSLSTNTVGGGFVVNFSDKMSLNLGFDYVMYQKDKVNLSEKFSDDVTIDYANTYEKNTIVFGVGLDMSF